MAIVTSEKIFVDPKEEVTTVLERLLKSDKPRVILVTPLNSLLLSSYVTINILFREIARSPKLTVLVTEDEYGANIAKKAGFQVVSKVSLVTSAEWDKAMAAKKELLQHLAVRKKSLLENFQGDEAIDDSVMMANPEILQDIPAQDFEAQSSSLENLEVPAGMPNELPPEELKQEGGVNISEEVSDVKAPTEKYIDPAVAAAEDEIVRKFKKPRREPKITQIEGIEIFSGGDILSLDKPQTYDKIGGAVNSLDNNITENMNLETPETNNIPTRRNLAARTTGRFTGKDFTRSVSKSVPFGGFFQSFRKGASSNLRSEAMEGINPKRKKILLFGLIALVFLFLGGGYVLAFQSSSVDITLELKKEDVSTSASIIVDTDSTEMTLDPLTIPGIILQADNLSISRTGEANGEGKKGNKASGTVDLINLTQNEIILNAGTKVTSISNSLVYALKQNTTVPAGTRNGDGLVEAKRLEDVQVEATDFGDQYNISGTSSNTTFSVEGYSRSSQLQATRYADFTGGTVTTFTSVSGDNVAKVKEEALPLIKKDGETKVKLQLPDGYRYLEETLEFVEKEVKSNPDVNAESIDKTFNLSITGSVKAIAVKDEDLEKAITHILEEDKTKGGQVSVKGIEDLKIDKIEKADNKLILTVSSKSSLQKDLTLDNIKEDIAGKSVNDAKDYLNLLDEVEKYKMTFNPEIVPESIRRVPADVNRITIKIK